MTILSATLGRSVWFNRGYYILYPNLFTVLVAGSARCRKSTAINIGTKLLEDLTGRVKIISGKASPERFLHEFASETTVAPPALIHADELSVFLTRDQQGDKMIDLLTKLFDCPSVMEYRTWRHGIISLRNVFVTILAGATPESLNKSLPDTAFGGGFASRILFIYQKDTIKRNALPELTQEELVIKELLRNGLQKISRVHGEVLMTEDCKQYFREWYDNLEPPDDPRFNGYFGRKHDHVLRIALILCASQLSDLTMTKGHIDGAILALSQLEQSMQDALGGIGTIDTKGHIERMLRQIKERRGHIGHSAWLKMNYHYLRGPEFREIIDTLMTTGVISRDPNNHTWYVLNEKELGK